MCRMLIPIVSEIIDRANKTHEINVDDVEVYASFCVYGQLGILLNNRISVQEKSKKIKSFFNDLFKF